MALSSKLSARVDVDCATFLSIYSNFSKIELIWVPIRRALKETILRTKLLVILPFGHFEAKSSMFMVANKTFHTEIMKLKFIQLQATHLHIFPMKFHKTSR